MIGVSSIGRHLAITHKPLEDELRELADPSELGVLLGRAAVAYREAVVAIGDEAPAARAAADDLVGKMTRFGKRWRELEAEASRSLPADLKERLMPYQVPVRLLQVDELPRTPSMKVSQPRLKALFESG